MKISIFNIRSPLRRVDNYDNRLNFLTTTIDLKSNKIKRVSLSPLYGFSDYDESKSSSGLSFKIIGVLVLGIVGLFGSDIFGSLNTIKTAVIDQSKPSITELKGTSTTDANTNSANRGSLTRLTKREINSKLSQLPVFFISTDEGKSIYINENDNTGKFFIDKSNADKYSVTNKIVNSKTCATTMDVVYYPLIVKKQKIGSFIDGIVGNANPTAKYELEGSIDQLAYTSDEWQSKHIHDIPLFRAPGLAFQKNEGLEIPLFVRKEDALNSYQRLLDSKQSDSDFDSSGKRNALQPSSSSLVKADEVVIQITSLYDMISLLSTGGFEGRAIEFYPSIESINDAKELLK